MLIKINDNAYVRTSAIVSITTEESAGNNEVRLWQQNGEYHKIVCQDKELFYTRLAEILNALGGYI